MVLIPALPASRPSARRRAASRGRAGGRRTATSRFRHPPPPRADARADAADARADPADPRRRGRGRRRPAARARGVVGVVLACTHVTCVLVLLSHHRYFSHRAFSTSRAARFALAAAASVGAQRGPLWWASNHRRHHRFCETEDDPHCPRHGVLWAHGLWACDRRNFAVDAALVDDWLRVSPELVLLEAFCLPLGHVAQGALRAAVRQLAALVGIGAHLARRSVADRGRAASRAASTRRTPSTRCATRRARPTAAPTTTRSTGRSSRCSTAARASTSRTTTTRTSRSTARGTPTRRTCSTRSSSARGSCGACSGGRAPRPRRASDPFVYVKL